MTRYRITLLVRSFPAPSNLTTGLAHQRLGQALKMSKSFPAAYEVLTHGYCDANG